MKIKSNGVTKQKRRVLLLALYLLKHYGVDRPQKQQVLDFIRQRDLMHIPPEDENFREAGEEVWKHDLSWMRNTLKNNGLLRNGERGVWELTDAGERDVEAWAQRMRLLSERKPNWADNFESHADPDTEYDDEFHCEFYITETAVRWGLKIAERLKN
jgi:hypothetical protein